LTYSGFGFARNFMVAQVRIYNKQSIMDITNLICYLS
jgi:hypothetical protein